MTKTYQHIYLSPHYDDAALSCGGTIHQQTQAGEPVLIVTICAAPPLAGSPFSPFALEQHQKWGDPSDAVALRRGEDQAAMQILGADYAWLDFVDCIYRGQSPNGPWFYNNDDELFGEIHPDDQGLVGEVAKALKNQIAVEENSTIYAPLTVGYHVDHQLVHEATWELYPQGQQVIFYEDYPYVDAVAYGNANLSDTLTRLAYQHRSVKSSLHFFSKADLKTKIESVNAYTSQIETLFGSQAEATQAIQNYACQIGEGQPAERFWIPE